MKDNVFYVDVHLEDVEMVRACRVIKEKQKNFVFINNMLAS
jgi:hypothetical protein